MLRLFFFNVLFFGVFITVLFSQSVKKIDFKNQYRHLDKVNIERSINSLCSYSILDSCEILRQIDELKVDSILNITDGDSLRETQLVSYYKSIFSGITELDPHFRFMPHMIVMDKKVKSRDIKVLPFTLMCINDTLIVEKSGSEQIKEGSRIISINGVSDKILLSNTYHDRYTNTIMMQMQNHFLFSNSYKIKVQTKSKISEFIIEGIPIDEYNKKISKNNSVSKLIGNVGYITLDQFRDNTLLLKNLNKLIDDICKKGGNNVIIDLRKNTGGTGDEFDKVLSLFTPKKELPYQSQVFVKLSILTEHYNYLRDSIGTTISLPDSLFYSSIPTDNNLYRGKLNYYILVSEHTGSQAATFVNILQYNNLATIVGEPLKKNAYLYGEVAALGFQNSVCYVSTVKYEEHTKAINGVLQPDIHIPFIAREHMDGGDPVLDKLINEINQRKNE